MRKAPSTHSSDITAKIHARHPAPSFHRDGPLLAVIKYFEPLLGALSQQVIHKAVYVSSVICKHAVVHGDQPPCADVFGQLRGFSNLEISWRPAGFAATD